MQKRGGTRKEESGEKEKEKVKKRITTTFWVNISETPPEYFVFPERSLDINYSVFLFHVIFFFIMAIDFLIF